MQNQRKPWGWHTRYRGHKEDEPINTPKFLERKKVKIMGGDYPDTEYAKTVCKVGQDHACCRYLTMHPDGWSCEKHGTLNKYFDHRASIGAMTARGDNCPGKDSR